MVPVAASMWGGGMVVWGGGGLVGVFLYRGGLGFFIQ